jgi:hypothetical protein
MRGTPVVGAPRHRAQGPAQRRDDIRRQAGSRCKEPGPARRSPLIASLRAVTAIGWPSASGLVM